MNQTIKGGFEFIAGRFVAPALTIDLSKILRVFSLYSLMISLIYLPITSSATSEATSQPVESVFQTELKLATDSYQLLVIEEPKVVIKPGISRAQAAEAERRLAQSLNNRHSVIRAASAEEAHKMAATAAIQAGIAEYWPILAAIWQVESGKAIRSCIVSKADGRAVGPMQFMPNTFRAYHADGDGDGQADICNARDALVAAANLLKLNGLKEGKVNQAIHRYNHSMAYVNKVKRIAESIN